MTLKHEVAALQNAFTRTDHNSFKEKATMLTLLFMWVALEIGTAAGQLEAKAVLPLVRTAALAMIFRIQGLELGIIRAREGNNGKKGGK